MRGGDHARSGGTLASLLSTHTVCDDRQQAPALTIGSCLSVFNPSPGLDRADFDEMSKRPLKTDEEDLKARARGQTG